MMRLGKNTGCIRRRCRSQKSLSLVEKSLAEDHRIEPESEVLDKMLAVGDEDFLDQVGMANKQDAAMGEAKLDHVAILARAAGQEVEPMRAEIGQIAGEPVSFRSDGRSQ